GGPASTCLEPRRHARLRGARRAARGRLPARRGGVAHRRDAFRAVPRPGRGLRPLPAADDLPAACQARRPAARRDPRGAWRRLRADQSLVRGHRHLRAQGVAGLRLAARRHRPRRPGDRAGLPRRGVRARRHRAAARPRTPARDHVRHLGRPHVGVVRRLRRGALPLLLVPQPPQLLGDAEAPRPHAHLAQPSRRARADVVVPRAGARTSRWL
ncbi:MAG: hypothetical protein AVDCRST_MAG32-3170, partial [uncultured Nocardioides sp.]